MVSIIIENPTKKITQTKFKNENEMIMYFYNIVDLEDKMVEVNENAEDVLAFLNNSIK